MDIKETRMIKCHLAVWFALKGTAFTTITLIKLGAKCNPENTEKR
ncbi:hypothetical protein GCM10009133_13140 [Cocleimonas flava]